MLSLDALQARLSRLDSTDQRDAVHLAEKYIEKWGGGFVSDVVALGKSFIGAAIGKRYEQLRRAF